MDFLERYLEAWCVGARAGGYWDRRLDRFLVAGLVGMSYDQFLASEWSELLIAHHLADRADSLRSGGRAPQEEVSMSWRTSRADGFTYAQVRMEELHALVTSVTSVGCGISFGQTKDRSACVITIFAGDSGKEVTYARSDSDVAQLLSDTATAEFGAWAKEHQPV
jgi:hypothetical protein